MTRSIPAALAIATLLWMSSTDARAATVFTETFEPPGQTGGTALVSPWGAFTVFNSYPTLVASTEYAIGGTQGAGSSTAAGSGASLGATYSSGTLSLSFDNIRLNTTSDLLLYLYDSVSLNALGFNWSPNPSMAQHLEGITTTGAGIHLTGAATRLHTSAEINLTAKTVTYSWYEIGNPGNGGSAVESWTAAFAPNRIELFRQGAGQSGWDSISLAYSPIPEPAGVALALLGLAALRKRVAYRGPYR